MFDTHCWQVNPLSSDRASRQRELGLCQVPDTMLRRFVHAECVEAMKMLEHAGIKQPTNNLHLPFRT